jgi:antitoxin ParD1/3/4|nr:type II toxin-antitoxin system ParD family antitoxin [Rhodopirellula europaea]|tara:strand:- start:744 stop:980 length:237 start_codon:yes stop_codon:yes gene_type:complete
MDIQLPHDQRSAIEALVTSGRYDSVQEAVSEGIRMLVSNEKLREAVQVGIDQADKGELHDHDTVFAQLKAMAAEAKHG